MIAGLHGIADAASTFKFLEADAEGDSPLRRNLARTRAWYDYAVPDGGPSPLIERGLAWLDAHVPTGTDTVLCWGDARIGNVLYRDFEPVGVLDWEMAAVGPREMDLAWLVFAHRVFESIAGSTRAARACPTSCARTTCGRRTPRLTGIEVGDLTWYQLYDAVQWGIVFLRTGARQVRFGEIEAARRHRVPHASPAAVRAAPRRVERIVVGPLDEYPIHQVPLPVTWAGSSDRNFYDRVLPQRP